MLWKPGEPATQFPHGPGRTLLAHWKLGQRGIPGAWQLAIVGSHLHREVEHAERIKETRFAAQYRVRFRFLGNLAQAALAR